MKNIIKSAVLCLSGGFAPVFILTGGLFPGLQANAQNGTVQNNSEIVRERHGDWDVRCSRADRDSCFMVSLGTRIDGTPVIEMSVTPFPPGGLAVAGATFIAPLGTSLPEGMVLQIDTGQRIKFAYDFCAPAGCVANLALTRDLVTAMKAGGQVRISVVPASQTDIVKSVNISLGGFTAAYHSLHP